MTNSAGSLEFRKAQLWRRRLHGRPANGSETLAERPGFKPGSCGCVQFSLRRAPPRSFGSENNTR